MASRIVIVPGNGTGEVEESNWYGWLKEELQKAGINCTLKNMPDPLYAHMNIWIPFMKNALRCDQNTLIVGHSSGAVAAMRYAETYPIYGFIIISAYTSDLGDEIEEESGYFKNPWQWEAIKKNTKIRLQFGSEDDPFLPWSEQLEVHTNLDTELFQFKDRGHFQSFSFPALFDVVKKHIA